MDIFGIVPFFKELKKYIFRPFNHKRAVTIISLALLVALSLLFYKVYKTNALSRGFIQTDWTGGADTVSTADDTRLLDWNKYYSKTTGVDTSTNGHLKLNLTISQP